MKIRILKTLFVLSILIPGCSGMQITGDSIKQKLSSTADSIKKNKADIFKLDNKTVGNKGYFYILRKNGTISYHPKKALINFDFSGSLFIKKILNKKNGCISFNADGVRRLVFFTEIDSGEILCLTIEDIELDEPINDCDTNIEE